MFFKNKLTFYNTVGHDSFTVTFNLQFYTLKKNNIKHKIFKYYKKNYIYQRIYILKKTTFYERHTKLILDIVFTTLLNYFHPDNRLKATSPFNSDFI